MLPLTYRAFMWGREISLWEIHEYWKAFRLSTWDLRIPVLSGNHCKFRFVFKFLMYSINPTKYFTYGPCLDDLTN